MLERTQIDNRLWLLASLVAGIGYWALKDANLPALGHMALKGAGVALLATYAFAQGNSANSRQIAIVMAFGALGDVLIELSLQAGAVTFLIGHLIAIRLYLKHRARSVAPTLTLGAAALAAAIPVIAFWLPSDRAAAPGIAVYAVVLAGMTGTALLSTFPRVGIGALMFAVSDLLIFARVGPLSDSALPGLLIWPLYYFGQVLICTGVAGELRRRD